MSSVDSGAREGADGVGANASIQAGTHVVMRNRHTSEIAAFLAERNVPIANVHTTKSKESKAAYMQETLGAAERALFVDDAASEVNDPAVALDPRFFRVLFQI